MPGAGTYVAPSFNQVGCVISISERSLFFSFILLSCQSLSTQLHYDACCCGQRGSSGGKEGDGMQAPGTARTCRTNGCHAKQHIGDGCSNRCLQTCATDLANQQDSPWILQVHRCRWFWQYSLHDTTLLSWTWEFGTLLLRLIHFKLKHRFLFQFAILQQVTQA